MHEEIKVGVDRLGISEGLQPVYPGYLPIRGVVDRKPGKPESYNYGEWLFRMAFLFTRSLNTVPKRHHQVLGSRSLAQSALIRPY